MKESTPGPLTDVSVLEIGGKRFVTGLRWQNLRSSTKYMDEARTFGRDNHMDIVAIRVSKVIQAGFVSKANGVNRSMYSLAAVLIDTLGQSWLAAFDLGDGRFYLVAADKDAIVPDTDFVGDEQKALSWARALAGQLGWSDEQIIVPESWAMGGREESLDAIMERAPVKRTHRLKALPLGFAREEWVRLGLTTAGALTLAGAGYLLWQQHMERIRQEVLAAARVRAEEMARLSEEQARMIATSSLTRPWTLKPLPAAFLATCIQWFESMPLSIGGWSFQSGQCNATTITASYKRSVGATNLDYLSEFQRVFPIRKIPTSIHADETASFSIPMSMKAGGDEFEQISSNTRDDLVSHFQRIDHKLTVTQTQSISLRPEILPNGQPWPKDLAPPPPAWSTYTFAFDSAASPASVLAGLSQTGMRIESVDMKLDASTAALSWHTNGVIYARQ